ncbi:hypothetical protein RhiirA5_500357 [Rhizophagus irregularis]|uniref:Uncharacterized protein n=2 Tax=Rhizophagus irregularis TaxID=588596 RepID=A0A2I1EXG4_9GLOM|nr:hypothetical protein GLOIN_2v1774982 [Rhizophagus irregularis DAOM 181602=DAOM 197198]PKC07898.1 hypothetical protein RhiirA5_500357 [Rhizophagus irregularis]PKC61968.1 hypothetical protein RhiirA1_538827 [Rhizophagus irregularis]PKY26813.1 hypothetical protein RhiirB3_442256 [Rhizophagus irregularis]POG71239.1 hypothetical protein GLOIN_2v1774982 [Rhizophagus irregularis DAOM 181602=DAOM 197198]UZO24511.1 hypothetical protein OCT59_016808 [Rhizophagus irregularis]|eukprot:XP_025178105.1 hypothetical protein GLOIN_2v1774982 [Rhizophagus irregularis DAOM 181602=DAOM 197198]
MDFYRYILTCIVDTDYKDWNVLNCLNYLKDHNHLQFTSDSKQEILSAFTSVFKKISESCTINSRVTKKAKKLYDNVHETFQRREITEFFEKVDREFEERRNERELEKCFDKNGCELLIKSSDFHTLKLSSRYAGKSEELPEKDESVSDRSDLFLRKKRSINYNEERMIKRLHRDRETTPSPCSPKLHLMDNPFIEDKEDDVIIIDDVDELCFEEGDPANDLKVGDTNVAQLFRKYQNESLKIANNGGLLVESNVHEILSLSSIFLLTPGSHPNTMIDIFSSSLLDEVHEKVISIQQSELDPDCELKFRKAAKKAIKESRECAVDWLWTELSNDQALKENLGIVFLECLRSLPTTKIKNQPSEITLITNHLDHIMKMLHNPDKHIVEWPNTGLDESKARKLQGRSKQPDFTVSIIHQLQDNGVIFVGEVSPPSEKNNVYKNCNDLIRVGVFMKDCLDSAIGKGADIKVLGFQCIDHTIDFYVMDLVQGIYILIKIGQVAIPTSLKEVSTFIEDMEILLIIRKVFQQSFDKFFDKLCNPSLPSVKASLRRDTLRTPKFRQLVSKTRNCRRNCPFWFGRDNR